MAADLNIINNVLDAEKRLISKEQILGKGLNMPFNVLNSGSRKIMFSTQMDHRVELMNPEPPLISTGYENRFGEHSSSFIRSGARYVIVSRIEKFAHLPGHHYYLIVKKLDSDEYDIIERKTCEHTTESYGYLYNNKYLDSLKIGSVIENNDVIRKSTSYDEYNNRMDGVNLITTYLSNEDTKEDGITVSQTAAKKLSCPLIKNIQITVNDNDIMLNVYGDDKIYKVIPDIGQDIQRGLLCAMRREKKEESLFSQSLYRLQRIMMSDDTYIAKGKVVDIDVFCNNPAILSESHYMGQLKYYHDNTIRFMNEIVSIISPIIETPPNKCSYNLQKLYYDSKKILEGKKYIKDKPFSNTILNITVFEESILNVGDKISNRYGGKGVVSKIRSDELMPLLDTGERVEVIFNSATCINRENIGQLFETSLNHISSRLLHYMENVLDSDDCIEMVKNYISIINPNEGLEFAELLDKLSPEERQYFFDSIVSDDGIMLSLRPISDPMNIDILNALYKQFPYVGQHKVIVPIRNSNGDIRYIETRRRLTCGKQYFYRLKQYAEEKLSSTSLSSTNFKNENSRSSAKKSYKTILTKTPIRFGEMESGNLLHLGAEIVVINLLLYSASPKGRRLAEQLLTEDPFNIDIKLTDECTNRGVEILNAYLLTMGLRIKFVKMRKHKKSPIKFVPITITNMRTSIRFINPNDMMGEQCVNNTITNKKKSPIKFVPISFDERSNRK